MPGKFDKNYTAEGYLMNYEKFPCPQHLKNRVLQFYIELQDIEPKIWRRILVPPEYNFWDLHTAIQNAMGWTDSHLHDFEIKGKRKKKTVQIGIPDLYGTGELPEVFPGWEIPVTEHFNDLGVTANYLYDYGDYWMHTVRLEGYLIRYKKQQYPQCVTGARACPPDDCGGVHGYYRMLEILSDPDHEEHEEMKIWLGGNFDPDHFNKNQVRFQRPYHRWLEAFMNYS